MLAENGIDEASLATWDGLVAAFEKLAAAGIQPVTMPCDGNTLGQFVISNQIIANNVDDYRAFLNGDKTATSGEGYINALNQFRSLIELGYCGVGANALGMSDAISAFGYGEAAFRYRPSWNNPAIVEAAADEFTIGLMWHPVVTDAYTQGTYVAGWGSPLSGWAVNAATEDPVLTVQVCKEICKAEAARHLNAGLGTNHVQDGAPTPQNYIEEERFVLREGVTEYLNGWWQNTMDNACITEWTQAFTGLAADEEVDVDAIVAQFDAAWQANTFFD